MRIILSYLTLLERQIQVLSNMIEVMVRPEECLNRKFEWGVTKILGLVTQI